MYQAQEGVVVVVDVRALRTVRFIASVRICWPPSFTTSASMAATLWYLATEIRGLPSLTKYVLPNL
jgi:hypothetical protein